MNEHKQLVSRLIPSPLGSITISATSGGVRSIQFTTANVECNGTLNEVTHPAGKYLLQTQQELKEYFQGNRTQFEIPLDIQGTDFQLKVWRTLKAIPFGETRTYQEQALTLGCEKIIRASASANACNPVAIIIPCHRVIGKNGSMTGYAGGIDRKKALIDLEKKYTRQFMQGALFS